jgi:hypothetical protein
MIPLFSSRSAMRGQRLNTPETHNRSHSAVSEQAEPTPPSVPSTGSNMGSGPTAMSSGEEATSAGTSRMRTGKISTRSADAGSTSDPPDTRVDMVDLEPMDGPASSVQRRDSVKPSHYKVICISMYTEDLRRLDEMVESLKSRGLTKANRSALIRYALGQVDLDRVPKGL